MLPDKSIRRTAILCLLLAMAACATQPTGPDPAVTRFNGIYQGTQTSQATGPDCVAGSRPVQFRVTDGHVWNHRHGRHRRMDGNVDAQGRVTMEDEGGDLQITATIADGRFTGSETTAPAHSKTSPLEADAALSCLSLIEAARSSVQDAGPDR